VPVEADRRKHGRGKSAILRTYEWVKSRSMLEQTDSALDPVNMDVQARAHAAA
jgi:hypothetical protein